MRYFNQSGERISETEFNKQFIKATPELEIKGWAIDITKCDIGDHEEFIRLWKKIQPIPLYTLFNQ